MLPIRHPPQKRRNAVDRWRQWFSNKPGLWDLAPRGGGQEKRPIGLVRECLPFWSAASGKHVQITRNIGHVACTSKCRGRAHRCGSCKKSR
jgi:hypothetical protein